jgi:hypothetical protein
LLNKKLFWQLRYRARSGVLQLALGIALVISVLCSSIILLAYYSKLSFTHQEIGKRLTDNATSGIQYGMANRDVLQFNKAERIDLFGEMIDSVEIVKRPWGIFELISARAFLGNHVVRRSAFMGAIPDKIGQAIIYTPDNNAPVYLSGNTSIKGNVFASERKFSSADIEGRDFRGDRFVYGDIMRSDSKMPKLDTTLISELKSLLLQKENIYQLNPAAGLMPKSNPDFNGPSRYYFTEQSLDITDSIQGNVIIHSLMKVHISSGAKLADIIIVAPVIDIDEGFQGSIQCFASEMITLGKGSLLKYPSALVLVGDENDSTIVVKEGAEIDGFVIIAGYDQTTGSKATFKIEKGGSMHGMAYINGAADIQGRLWGHITSRSFEAATTRWTVYGNHILDGEFDGIKRSPYLQASLLWGGTKALKVTKWID